MASKKSRSNKESRLIRQERKRSKRLGYSLTYSRHKREREASKKYVETAKRLAEFVPSLKKAARSKRLTSGQKAAITRRAKQLRHVSGLKALTKKQARQFKEQLFAPGVRAIQLRDVHEGAEIKSSGKDFIVTQNGRRWIYWRLDRATVKSKSKIKEAGRKAFEAQFPIEIVTAMAQEAFASLKPIAVTLWVSSGRMAETFENFSGFLDYVNEKWQAGRYFSTSDSGKTYESDPEKFINGLAILVSETKIVKSQFTRKTNTGEMG